MQFHHPPESQDYYVSKPEQICLEDKVQTATYQSSPSLSYISPHSYQERWEQERRDILKFVPWNTMEKFPLAGNESLYGWTHRHKDGKVHLRDDLQGLQKLETDLHECGHTPDEYETRRRTEWKMECMLPKEERYKTKPPVYKI